ncbi:hypothetical protein DRV84_10125 [Rhodosalinus sediminis]|uniref:Transferrin-binding protein B C-lobe/N-lobe beta barrel domain-containing protein n=2 Tax=Rhodosalinus sediminis TaxID=1940533 RepID=A0A3D9BRN4_9RHOB|nr:hypothetical protein DRV84_10125 [Rhodosalinus sediminis]
MASALALAACSSSDSNGGLTTPDMPAETANSGGDDSALITAVKDDAAGSAETVDSGLFDGDLDTHFAAIDNAPDTAAAPADLTGDASYAGSLEVGEDLNRIMADVEMNVDFDDAGLTGELANFRELDDNGQPQDLDITANLTGTVDDSRLTASFQEQFDTGDGTIAASGLLEGVFVGDGSEVLGEARITSEGGGERETLDGTFHATEQTTP